MDFLLQIDNKGIIIRIIQITFFSFFTYCIALKISNKNQCLSRNIFVKLLILVGIGIVHVIINDFGSIFYSMIFLFLTLTLLFEVDTSNNTSNSMLVIIISLCINYVLYFIAISLSFAPNALLDITNNYIGLLIMLLMYLFVIRIFFKIKRFKNGFAFLQNKKQNEYLDILILNICVVIIFSFIIISNYDKIFIREVSISLLVFIIIMFITIQKSLQLYYKQKQLIKTLEETQAELEKYKKDVKDLEEENLNISKKSHSLVHKQKQLEYKLNELLSQTETTITEKEKEELNSRIENISKELYTEKAIIELTKTDIPNIDDMLKYQQSECIKNKIDFDLQISGNIHHMINTLISKEDLEILIVDHVKDAIIAINHSNNENRSILVRLGKIDECYGIYIYDTGIEFEKETLENLGKKPSTTHADEGGTGMGFMNTFDTLRKCKASLIIKEIGKPSKDNFTKVIMIKFNNKQEFRVESYRNINIEVKLGQDSNNENNSKSEVTIK